MLKTIPFLLLALILFIGNAQAAFIRNVTDGSFEFQLDIRHMGSYVNYAKLSLFFQDQTKNSEAIVFDEITITSIGQVFEFTESDSNFSGASAFLTNGQIDLINVSLSTPTRTSSIDGTEPEVLFGATGGSSAVDFAGSTIESIKLLVTDLFFISGFDPNQGVFTNIAVQGVVSIETVGSSHIAANFSADPTSGPAPLRVHFTDRSTGTIDSWYWRFGDGFSSDEQNPSYTYSDTGSYTVTLSVTGPDGSDEDVKTDYIRLHNVPQAMPWLFMLMD